MWLQYPSLFLFGARRYSICHVQMQVGDKIEDSSTRSRDERTGQGVWHKFSIDISLVLRQALACPATRE